jgi:hypothetical protein
MAETDSIVGIYGAVDEAVQTDSAARERVAELLAQYRDPKVHWFDDYKKWLAGATGAESSGPAFPDAETALRELAGTAPPTPRARARRMFAIAVASRVLPELREADSEPRRLAEESLRVIGPDGGVPAAKRLFSLLAGEAHGDVIALPARRGWWDSVIAAAVEDHLIPAETGMFPRPCSGRLVTVPGVAGPAAALTTEVENDEIDFEHATRFIEPVNWRTCMPSFWCAVHPIGRETVPGVRCYHEVVSTHCTDRAAPGFWAETDLLFDFMYLPDKANAQAAVANYELAKGRPLPDDLIQVDEGTILVAKVDPPNERPVRVTTTKRVLFSYPFSSEALALVMCALGYADIAGNLLSCAAERGIPPKAAPLGTAFPGVSLAAAPHAAGREGAREEPDRSRDYSQTGVGGLMQDTVDIWARALRDSAAAMKRGARG